MAKVRIRRAGFSGPGKLTNERLADALIQGGKFEIVEDAKPEPVAAVEPEPESEPDAVIEFAPSPKLDEAITAEEKPKAKRRSSTRKGYKRRDMKAED